MKKCPFNPVKASRGDIEGVIAWINCQTHKSSTKGGLESCCLEACSICPLCQLRQEDACASEGCVQHQQERGGLGVKPESLLSLDDVKAMINAAENERDKALISVLFEATLRPGEILTMNVGSVIF